MNVKKMLEMQKQLDVRIKKQHHLCDRDVINEKILAFQVELGELANETRCFKFWSLKAASERAVILEEYVDGVHFILSIALDLKMTDLHMIDNDDDEEASLTDQFLLLFSSSSELVKRKSEVGLQQLFGQYIRLGKMLHFSTGEIETAYVGKNEVNHQRQDEGY